MSIRACVIRGAGRLAIQSWPEPALGENDVLVAPAFVGICGSDLHYYQHGRNGDFVIDEPLILGHELSGTVVAAGRTVADAPKPGERVVIHPATPSPQPGAVDGGGLNRFSGGAYLGSASTTPHTQGALAERIAVRPDQLRPVPAGLPLPRAALAEPLAVCLHAIGQLGDVRGKRVFVSGAGPIGLLTVVALKSRGASWVAVSDLVEGALARAKAVGADETVHVGHDTPLAAGSIDFVVEASGSVRALSDDLRVVADGGVVVQLGVLPPGDSPVPLGGFISREITLRGSWRFDIELDEAIAVLAATPQADALISHVVPFDDVRTAFDLAADPGHSAKVLIQVGSDSDKRV